MIIQRTTISLQSDHQSAATLAAFVLDALNEKADDFAQELMAATDSGILIPPRIGEIWEGQGGRFMGTYREPGAGQRHLILCLARPSKKQTWQKSGEWARSIVAECHHDFDLPTRIQGRLIAANWGDQIEDRELYHWLKEQYSEGGAWGQNFYYGDQDIIFKTYEAPARAVRSIQA